MARSVFLFAGPSLHGTPWAGVHEAGATPGYGLSWLPPARRGDIDMLVAQHAAPGVIGLADGTFHSYPSVGHRELRQAIQAGWLVFGLCSMGAIRVSELSHMGMLPWGRVARMFCTNPELADDEVALVHSAEAPYLPFSEPMVHLREFLCRMRARGLLGAQQEQTLVHSFRERWYGDRTLPKLAQELAQALGAPAMAALQSELDDFSPYRLKQQDLLSFVASKPWLYVPEQAAAGRV